MIYKAKKDINIILIPLILELFLVLYKFFFEPIKVEQAIVAIFLCDLLLSFYWIMLFTVQYVCTDSELIIKNIFFEKKIIVTDIKKIKRVIGTYSFSASSCNQIEIIYGDMKKIRISPIDIDECEEYLLQFSYRRT